jgi:hypothetical protein
MRGRALTKRGVTCCAALITATTAASARADPPDVAQPGGRPRAPPDADVAARLAWIEGVLDREEATTRLWRSSWLAIYGGVTLAEGGLLGASTTSADRVNAAINGGKAAVAFTFVLVSPTTGSTAGTSLHGALAETPAQRLAKLRRAEALLRTVAREEHDARGWFPLIGGSLLNAGGAWLAWATTHGSAGGGWFGLVSGVAVAQAQFYTTPTGALSAWDAYARAGNAVSLLRAPGPRTGVSIAPGVGSLSVQGWF